MQKDHDVGDRETTIDGKERNIVEGRKAGNRSIAGREMCVGDGGMAIGGMICDKKIMTDKDVNDVKELTGTVMNNDGIAMKIEFALGVVMRSKELCGGDQVGATLDDKNENFYRGIIKKDCKEIVNDARRKMYIDWKTKTEYLKSADNVTNTSDGIHDLNESSNNIGVRDLRESEFQKSALRLRIERTREKNINLIPRLDSCNENNKLSGIKDIGDIINKDKVSVSNAITDNKNRVNSGDGNRKDEQSENDNVVYVDRHEVTTEIMTNFYKDIFGEVDEKDTINHLIQLRQGEIEKDFTATEPHRMEMKMDEFKENLEYKHVERVLKEKGRLFNINKQILKENNGNSLSKADDQDHSRNIEKKINKKQNEVEHFEVNNDNTINMRLEELLNFKKGGYTRTLQRHQIPNSTSESIEIENITSKPIESENETSIEGPKHPRLKKLLALRSKTEQCHSEKKFDTRLQKLLASRKKNTDKNTQTLDT